MALADAIRVLKASLMAQGGGGDQVREEQERVWVGGSGVICWRENFPSRIGGERV